MLISYISAIRILDDVCKRQWGVKLFVGVTKTFASCLPNDENSRITGLQKKMNVLREETSARSILPFILFWGCTSRRGNAEKGDGGVGAIKEL
jgi:hypothetical protein